MKILVSGICGKMGKTLLSCSEDYNDISVIAGIDANCKHDTVNDIPIFVNFQSIPEAILPDCIIDFSSPQLLSDLLVYSSRKKIPVVLATTGYNDTQNNDILIASRTIPIFKSGNLSMGIATLIELVDLACKHLAPYNADVEIIESHHNQKVDSPSGTAKMLFDKVKSHIKGGYPTYGREGLIGKRDPKEIGVHSIRGGTIAGKHEVQFILKNEIITISHEAENRGIFGHGSIQAATFLIKQLPGLYSLSDLH